MAVSADQRVEYKVISPYQRQDTLEEILNEFAVDGWKLIDIARDLNTSAVLELIFVRPVE